MHKAIVTLLQSIPDKFQVKAFFSNYVFVAIL